MQQIRRHCMYAVYLAKHKWYVFYCGVKTGASLWRLVIHDWSKFSIAEWKPYVDFFYSHHQGNKRGEKADYQEGRTPEVKAAFIRAFHHHIHRNPHHCEYWLRYKANDGTFTPLEMPEKFVREMVADWAATGKVITGTWDLTDWYLSNKDKIKLHPKSRQLTEALISKLMNKLNPEALDYASA